VNIKFILLLIIFYSYQVKAQTYKIIVGDTAFYQRVPCVDVPDAKSRWECFYMKDNLNNGTYSIYYASDTTVLNETFTIRNKKTVGIRKSYHENGKLACVEKFKNGTVKLDSSFYNSGELALIHTNILPRFKKLKYSYSKTYFKSGKLEGENKIGFFRIVERRYCESGKLEYYAKYRKRDNKVLDIMESFCE